MAKINKKHRLAHGHTHEGVAASKLTATQTLRRTVSACFLWEDTFYEAGESIAERIESLVSEVPLDDALAIALEARSVGKLRHVPLLILVSLIRLKPGDVEARVKIGRAIPEIIQRADEMGEFISLYWRNGKIPLTKQMKIGLANAFKKFDEYQLAKYDSELRGLRIRDVMFLVHPKPESDAQSELFRRVAEKELCVPDTWETQLSGGADKKETFERLMSEGRLGVLAFLRNLRNMRTAGISRAVVQEYAERVETERALPFRFVAAARAVSRVVRLYRRDDEAFANTI